MSNNSVKMYRCVSVTRPINRMKNGLIANKPYLLLTSLIWLWVLCFPGGLYAGSEVREFNFGDGGQVIKNALPVTTSVIKYRPDRGSGFLSGGMRGFTEDTTYLKIDKRLYTGITSDQPIEFRVDVLPGYYWVEVLMAPGKKGIWRGEITLNDSVVATELTPFHTNEEGNVPPSYWTMMRGISVRKDAIIIRVAAKDQPSTLCGLSVYPDRPGPLHFKDGKISTTELSDTPNLELALRQINAGRIQEAEKTIFVLPEEKYRRMKAHLLLALAGRLEIADPRPLIEWAGYLFRQGLSDGGDQAEAALNLKIIDLYSAADTYYKMAGWDWAKSYSRQGIFNRLDLIGFALEEITQITNHPLYQQVTWYLGKTCYWSWVEQHADFQLAKADSCFRILYPYYRGHKLLNLYMGKPVSKDMGVQVADTKHPVWAVHASHALEDLTGIIHYWVNYRQAANGEFGGKYDDDVEMLRWWPIARMAADDSITLIGLRRLVDGVWNSDWIENGFSKKLRDVEHAAEPVADTQPMMIGLDYGNPVYVERCMESMQGLYNLWTGVNERGHRHFKSGWYSATEIDETPPKDCDVPMNTRTVKAARWLVWYNRHPVVMQFLKEWGDAWLEDCLRTDNGKPYGVVPAAIRFSDDRIGGYSDKWYAPELYWDYYDFSGGFDMMEQFLSLYQLFGDDRYLRPIEIALDLCKKYLDKNVANAAPGSEAWVAGIYLKSYGFAQVVEQWRLLTGKSEFDPILMKIGSDYLRFRLSGDVGYLVNGCLAVEEGARINRDLITSEAYYTDRVELRNLRGGANPSARHLESLYTGRSLLDGFFPFSNICWYGMNTRFAAVVLDSRADYIKVLACNLSDQPMDGEMAFWSLPPGSYLVEDTPYFESNPEPARSGRSSEVKITGPASRMAITLPAQQDRFIEVKAKEVTDRTEVLNTADLAVTGSDVIIQRSANGGLKVTVPVHNIGIKPADDFDVVLSIGRNTSFTIAGKKHIKRLEAPLDLVPVMTNIGFIVDRPPVSGAKLKIEIDPENHVEEITEINNRILIPLGY